MRVSDRSGQTSISLALSRTQSNIDSHTLILTLSLSNRFFSDVLKQNIFPSVERATICRLQFHLFGREPKLPARSSGKKHKLGRRMKEGKKERKKKRGLSFIFFVVVSPESGPRHERIKRERDRRNTDATIFINEQ